MRRLVKNRLLKDTKEPHVDKRSVAFGFETGRFRHRTKKAMTYTRDLHSTAWAPLFATFPSVFDTKLSIYHTHQAARKDLQQSCLPR